MVLRLGCVFSCVDKGCMHSPVANGKQHYSCTKQIYFHIYKALHYLHLL
ncbi:Protein of unknown function [Pyronema omphalodes CBS 100304]|uniref:Uncharacterized protein n=1 Tax=Pyronema omphalodes (strain CBS 100304) TaxID=1076935 RepID=U4LBF7_PYROM|nr:Protein of unknown function [Pyronema omphalodes CBS 100304]